MNKIEEIANQISEDPSEYGLKETTTRIYEVHLAMIYTPMGDECPLEEVKMEPISEVIERAIESLREKLQNMIPEDAMCSLVVADRKGKVMTGDHLPTLFND